MSACSFSTLRKNLVLTHGISPDAHSSVHIVLPPHTIGSVPSLSGHAIACRWRSLPRVRWHKASSSPQGSSSNGYCLCIITNQLLLCASCFPHPLLVLLLYCFMDTFSTSDLCLYKCKESIIHGTTSSVGCQNIISSVLLLHCGPVYPRLMSVQV